MTIHLALKALDLDGKPAHGGTGTWPLPADGKPGAWLEVAGPLVPCLARLLPPRRPPPARDRHRLGLYRTLSRQLTANHPRARPEAPRVEVAVGPL